MTARTRTIVALAALVLSIVPEAVLAQNGAKVSSFSGKQDAGVVLAACGEQVALTGTVHYKVQAVVNKNSLHLKVHANTSQVKGTSASGAKYVGSGVVNGEANVSFKGADVYTLVLHGNLIGQGQAPNLKLRLVAHVTMNAKGEVTSVVLKYEAECP